MSILIKGAKMPKNCWECLCNDLCGAIAEMGGACPFTEQIIGRDMFDAHSGIHPDCPLVEIPPHGDLIDRDKLMKSLEHEWDICMDDTEFANKIVPNGIKDAATVIESEVEE